MSGDVRFCMTFGMKVATESLERMPSAHPEGWVEIDAPDAQAARELAWMLFGNNWSMLHDEDELKREFFPRGCLLRVSVDRRPSTKPEETELRRHLIENHRHVAAADTPEEAHRLLHDRYSNDHLDGVAHDR